MYRPRHPHLRTLVFVRIFASVDGFPKALEDSEGVRGSGPTPGLHTLVFVQIWHPWTDFLRLWKILRGVRGSGPIFRNNGRLTAVQQPPGTPGLHTWAFVRILGSWTDFLRLWRDRLSGITAVQQPSNGRPAPLASIPRFSYGIPGNRGRIS